MCSLSKLCLFVFCSLSGLAPSIAREDDLSGYKPEKITRNMVWVDYEKWQLESRKIKNYFWMDRFEVTQKEFFSVMGNNSSFFKEEDHSVEKVT
jgi:hypothetical protein